MYLLNQPVKYIYRKINYINVDFIYSGTNSASRAAGQATSSHIDRPTSTVHKQQGYQHQRDITDTNHS